MVIDSSAVAAVFLQEPDADLFRALIEASGGWMSAFNLLETRTVILGRRGSAAATAVDDWLAVTRVQIAAFDVIQSRLAFETYARFGKGFHPARLNMGDCAAYALAKTLSAPLLFKGDDFRLTDIISAV